MKINLPNGESFALTPLGVEWLERLKRDEDPQTTQHLHDDFGYCCLGVACEVFMKHGFSANWIRQPNESVWEIEGAGFTPMRQTLPDSVALQLGIPYWSDRRTFFIQALIGLNDRGATFPEIAAFIENPVYPLPGALAYDDPNGQPVGKVGTFYGVESHVDGLTEWSVYIDGKFGSDVVFLRDGKWVVKEREES